MPSLSALNVPPETMVMRHPDEKPKNTLHERHMNTSIAFLPTRVSSELMDILSKLVMFVTSSLDWTDRYQFGSPLLGLSNLITLHDHKNRYSKQSNFKQQTKQELKDIP